MSTVKELVVEALVGHLRARGWPVKEARRHAEDMVQALAEAGLLTQLVGGQYTLL